MARVVVPLVLVVVVLAVAVLVLGIAYATLRRDLDVACHGVIANLDLTEWVRVCR